MMRIITRSASSLALCLAIAGCSSQSEFEVDRTADFSSFDSFSVNSAEIPAKHQSLQGNVDRAIATQLTRKGLKRADADAATVNIRYFLTLDEAAPSNEVKTKAAGELIVDVQDSLTGDVVWRSRSARDIPVVKGDESVMAASVQQWVNDMLQEYPGTHDPNAPHIVQVTPVPPKPQ
jgi:hypothetical protein